MPSPFDYAAQTRVLIVTDLSATMSARSPPPIAGCSWRRAAARSACSPRSRGCAPCTSASRRRSKRDGLPLLAQHVDAMSTATLVDIFRAEEDSCLLGTDAVRDGVDVPGRSLRLIVFDRVPWPRPDILHRARKPVFGGAQYDDRIARLRLRQAYGRLVRRADDRGVFVMLDRALPSRLLPAFPPGVPIRRLGLAEAVDETARFLGDPPAARGRRVDWPSAEFPDRVFDTELG